MSRTANLHTLRGECGGFGAQSAPQVPPANRRLVPKGRDLR